MDKIISDINQCSQTRARETDDAILLLTDCICKLYPFWLKGKDRTTVSLSFEDDEGVEHNYNVSFTVARRRLEDL